MSLLGVQIVAPSYTSAQEGAALEEIVVTAQKRLENISDIPLSIQAITGEQLDSENIVEMQDLASKLTNVAFSNSSGASFITIRGLGTGPTNTVAEQSVGLFVDNVYASRGYQFNAPFLDVGRVEVLKGPQGILAGKNSVAGAILIHSRRPTDQTEGYVRAGYDIENEGYSLEGALSGALSDNFYARLTAMTNKEGGWLDTNSRLSTDGLVSLQGDEDQNTNEVNVVRLSTVWEPSESVSVYTKLESSERETRGVHFGVYTIQPESGLLPIFTAADPNFGFVSDGIASNGFGLSVDEATGSFQTNDEEQFITVDAQSATLQVDWELGGGTLTSVSAYSAYESGEFLTQSQSPFDTIVFEAEKGAGGDELSQFTQELRFASAGGDTVDYVAGLFYMDRTIEQNGFNQYLNLGATGIFPPVIANFVGTRFYKEETTNLSVFGQLTWNISDTLRANIGARYTDEDKERPIHSVQADFLVPTPASPFILGALGSVPFTTADIDVSTVSEQSLDPSISVQWDVAEDIMLYASYTEGTKAGGFNANTNRLEGSVYDTEEAKSFEVGIKSFFMDNRINLNLAIFNSQYKDLQVSALDGNTSALIFQNAGEATSQGVEADFRFAANERLEIGGALAYLDASYDDYPGATCSVGISIEANCDLTTLTRNAAGDTLRFAPEVNGNLYANYSWGLNNGMAITFRGDIVYSDEYFITAQNDPFGVQESFVKLNMLAELRTADGDWTYSLVGKNLTDESTANFGGAVPFQTGAYWSNADKPRQIFINAQHDF